MKQLFKLQAEICKVLANPKRLEVLYVLKDGERSVGELVKLLGISKANLSQHLAVMRSAGIVNARREGVNIYYSVASKKITEACAIMRDVLMEKLEKDKDILKALRKGRA
ncbi:MAG TPA: ArsR family transcriptional regulator [Deltaproteobacteria bacterium]|nr:ArsR family transcriptional regulator [Deltaproteobacteria bacterium]